MDSSYKNLPEKISINEFRVDFGTGQISTDTKIEVIEPKVMDLLRYFVVHLNRFIALKFYLKKFGPNLFTAPTQLEEI